MAETTNLGYNTYISGTAKNITDCLEIIIYNKNELTSEDRVETINIYNISQVISGLERVGKYIKLGRNSSSDYFEYVSENGIISGFNVVIYLSPGTNTGIGYTEFINVQGKYRDIFITLDSKTEVEGSLKIDINNSLVTVNSSSGSRIWIGDELSDYTSGQKIKQLKEKAGDTILSPTGYTTHLTAFSNSPLSESNIWLGSLGVIKGTITEPTITALKIARDFPADPYGNEFSESYIGWYDNNDISYYSWEGLRYFISSLSITSRFGVPIKHTDTETGWDEVSDLDSSRYKIIGWEGKYAIVTSLDSRNTIIWDTVSRKIVSRGKAYVDGNDKNRRVVSIPEVSYAVDIISDIPDLGNTFYDIETYGRSNYINIIYRKGPWFVFRTNQDDLAIWSSLRMTLTTRWSEVERVFILSDSYIGIQSQDKQTLTIYTGLGENWNSDSVGYGGEQERYESARKDGKIIDCSGTLGDTWLKNFRRNIYPRDGYPEVKDLVGSLSGLIFYKNNGKLNYL